MSLDALKAMRAAMKAEKQAVTEESGKKYVTKADLEAAKLKRIRAEEDQERQEKASDNQWGLGDCMHSTVKGAAWAPSRRAMRIRVEEDLESQEKASVAGGMIAFVWHLGRSQGKCSGVGCTALDASHAP